MHQNLRDSEMVVNEIHKSEIPQKQKAKKTARGCKTLSVSSNQSLLPSVSSFDCQS